MFLYLFIYFIVVQCAGTNALKDARLSYDKIKQAFVGYCYGML